MAADRMSRSRAYCLVVLCWLACAAALPAQQQTSIAPVPRVVWFSGIFRPADGLSITPVETVTLAVYREPEGADPLWQETQNVVVRADGRYDVLLGSTTAEGLPLDLFASGEPRWLGVRFNRNGESEQPRMQLASVPYALKSADAATLGGRPASDYALASAAATSDARAASTQDATVSAPASVLTGTSNFIAKYVDTINVGNSALYENGGSVGVGTTAPLDVMHVRFTNTFGSATGLAVQNLGNTASSYSGMLFYDQNGALGQFQGFNNITHEYRINNIASGGSINFMLGSSSKFLVAPSGNIGIGVVPGATEKLRVAGNVVVDGNIGAKYQDVAEWVETDVPIEAGTVVIVDPSTAKSRRAVTASLRHPRGRRRVRPAGSGPRRTKRGKGDGRAKRPRPSQGGCDVWSDQDRRPPGYEPERPGTRCGRDRSRSAGKHSIAPARCSAKRSNHCEQVKAKFSFC